jgi:plastocyanin
MRVVLTAAVLSLLLAGPANAATKTYTFRHGPIRMGGFNVKFPKAAVRAPKVNGYVVGMTADLVDRRNRRITIRDVMLHHLVFHRRAHLTRRGDCSSPYSEPIYGTGEERQKLRFPPGYGYRIRRHDRWRITAMLMSHSVRAKTAYIRYRVKVRTGTKLTPVRPFWVRANGCGKQVSYPVHGGAPPGSTTRRTYRWRVPMDGRIVAVGGHLHGGARNLTLSQPRCRSRRLLDTAPRYAMPGHLYYRARPILHEPGPIDTRYFLSRAGIPVRKGERLRITGSYEASQPHPRVMAIMHVYLAPGRAVPRGCKPLPKDRRELEKRLPVRTGPPLVRVPLSSVRPDGRTYTLQTTSKPRRLRARATVDLERGRFRPAHISVPLGARVTWRFQDTTPHNVLFANGPSLIGTPTLSGGATRTSQFRVPGRYELFCYLHPMTMHEVVDVREPAASRGLSGSG